MQPQLITEARLREALGSTRTVQAGQEYFRQGRARVPDVGAGDGQPVVASAVLGSYSQTYHQTINLGGDLTGSGLMIDGRCSCPVGYNCKHVVAALLEWRATATDPFRAPPELAGWLAKIKDLAGRHSEAYAKTLRQSLVYLLDVGAAQGAAVVRPMVVKVDKSGRMSEPPKIFDANALSMNSALKYLRAADLEILPRLSPGRQYGPRERYELRGAGGAAALAAMTATGRCVWRARDGPIIKRGALRMAKAEWKSGEGEVQRFGFLAEGAKDVLVLKLNPPYYLDLQTRTAGPLDTGMPEALVAALLDAPAVPPGLAEEVAERLAAAFSQADIIAPLPRRVTGFETLRPAPRATARLTMAKVNRIKPTSRRYDYWGRRDLINVELPLVQLSFDYGPVRFDYLDQARYGVVDADGRGVRVARDMAAETRLVSRLAKEGLRRLDTLEEFDVTGSQVAWFSLGSESTPADFAAFMAGGRPALIAEGWAVEVDADFPLALACADEEGVAVRSLARTKPRIGG